LNQFNEKFIYLYADMIAVLSAKDAKCEEGKSVPTTFAFEKEIVLS